MSRMSGPHRKKIFDFLVHRDGERCFIGGEPGDRHSLTVDHWDNDNSNNDPPNLHLICRSMNNVKNPRGRDHRGKLLSSVCVCVCDKPAQAIIEPPRTISAEFLKNQAAEPAFLHWLFAETVHLGRVSVDDVIDCGATVAHVSQVTIHRYLKKAACKIGLFRFVEDVETKGRFVELKPEWNSFRQTEDERKLTERDRRREERKNVKAKGPKVNRSEVPDLMSETLHNAFE